MRSKPWKAAVLGLFAAFWVLSAADGKVGQKPRTSSPVGPRPMKTAAYPAPWPSAGSWIDYTSIATDFADPPSAQPDPSHGNANVPPAATDVDRGTSGVEPSVYYYYDSSNQALFFRLRLRGNPISGSALENYTWNALIAVDGTGFKRFIVEVNGSNKTPQIFIGYGPSVRQDIPSKSTCATSGEGIVWSTNWVIGTTIRSSAAAGGGYFFDWQIPLSGFVDCNGVQVLTPTSMFSMAFSTSATHMNPTQKDFVDKNNPYSFCETCTAPFGDPVCPTCGTTQFPVVTKISHSCGGGTNYSPITLNAFVMDALTNNASGTVSDSIASVAFSYRRSGTTAWTAIPGTPTQTGLDHFSLNWTTSSLTSGLYQLRVVVTDDQGHATESTSYFVNLGTCGATPIGLASFNALVKPGAVHIAWTTATEIETTGYYLWKSDSPKGPFGRLSDSLITARGGSTWGAAYEFDDFNVRDDDRPFYELEEVTTRGDSFFYGPIPAARLSLQVLAPSSESSFSAARPATFEWNANGLEYFRIEVTPDPTFSADVRILPEGGEFYGGPAPYQSFTPSRSEWSRLHTSHPEGTALYWRVIGRDSEGRFLMSVPGIFHIYGAGSTRSPGRGGR